MAKGYGELMPRLLVAMLILAMLAVACNGGDGGDGGSATSTPGPGTPVAPTAGAVTPGGLSPTAAAATPVATPGEGAIDLEAAMITLADLPEGWEPASSSPPNSLTGFDQSFFRNVARTDGAVIRVTLLAGTPEARAEMRDGIGEYRRTSFQAETVDLEGAIPSASKSVSQSVPGGLDELIMFEVGPVLVTIWVTYPADVPVDERPEDVASLIYQRLQALVP